jgi:hypothetical protein
VSQLLPRWVQTRKMRKQMRQATAQVRVRWGGGNRSA